MFFLAHFFWNFESLAQTTKKPQFVTLSYSHFVEFARWSLQYNNIDFIEHGYAPGQHVLPTISIRVSRDNKKTHFSSSSSISDKKMSPTSSPVMIHPDGSISKDSWEIVNKLAIDLEPIDPELKDILDKEFGPLTRQWAYFYLLKPQHIKIFNSLCTSLRHWFWRLLWFLGFGNYLISIMIKSFRSDSGQAKKECIEKLNIVLEKLSIVLKSKKSKFLSGTDKLGQADIALASLAAAIVFPENYFGGQMIPYIMKMEQHDHEFAQELAYWRKTDVGIYCLEIYEKYRFSTINE